MVEKIEKITRTKAVDNDVGKRFDSRGNNSDEEYSGFAMALRREIKKSERKPSQIPDAYRLELNNLGGNWLYNYGATDFKVLLN